MPRYIDADKATEEARLTYCKDCNSYNGVMCRACAFDDAMSFIDDFPEADVAPRAEVEKIIEEVKKKAEAYFWHHDSVSTSWFIEFCDELKKKYAEGEK